jgi:parallel beta helix pectate lyase-like protein
MKTRRPSRFAPVLGVLLFALFPVAPLQGQALKIFVASYGNDANDGSRGSPKRNFQAAHDAAAAGGQIVVLDTAGYGQLTINKSIAVTVPPGVNGFVTVTGNSNAIRVFTSTNDTVSLRGLIVEGNSTAAGGYNGIGILLGDGTVTIEDCTVRNFNNGILLSTTSAPHVAVHGSVVRGCYHGMLAEANGAGKPAVTITACRFQQNIEGLGARPINGASDFVAVAGSIFTNNNQGAAADSSSTITLSDCVFADNSEGIYSSNNAVVLVDHCNLTGNFYGVLPGVTVGGQVLSRGNNTLERNTNGNTFTSTYSAK